MPATVAIVGRANVGKSTLFNRLVGKRLALVDDLPGVTRDRREGDGQLGDLTFRCVDTAGFEEAVGDTLAARMRQQTERAIGDADVLLFVIDGLAGVTPLDTAFADLLRRSGKPLVLAVNKCEGRRSEAGVTEAWSLGLGDPVPISAAHGEGMGLLFDALAPFLTPAAGMPDDEQPGDGETADTEDEGAPLALAIVGRPNVGKSTLINRLLGDERLITGPEAGITRDAIAVPFEADGRRLRLIDTAGLRRRSRVDERLEGLSAADTLRAVRYAHVVVLVLDGALGLDKQDLTIARMVVDEGRALIIALNKIDLIDDLAALHRAIRERLDQSLGQARGVTVVALSASSGARVGRLLPAVFDAYAVWNRRIATGALNRWLEDALARHPPPLATAGPVKIRYVTQAKSRPPTFVLFCNRPRELDEAYLRYLAGGLRETFDLPGTPIRLLTRGGDNPYGPAAGRPAAGKSPAGGKSSR